MKPIERFAKFRAIAQEPSHESVSSPALDFFAVRPEPMVDFADPVAREPRAYPTSPERMDRAAKPSIVVEVFDIEKEAEPLRWLEQQAQADHRKAPLVAAPPCDVVVQEPLPESAYTAMREASVRVQRSKLSPSQRAAKRLALV